MSALQAHVADYLRLRRALGFKLHRPGQELPQFVTWLEAHGIETITVEAAISWARLPAGAHPVTLSHRLGAVRGFARYLHSIDPATQIPPIGVFGKQQRVTPYIYSPEEIDRLLQAARKLPNPLRAATYETLLGLLAATGLRLGEATHLLHADVDLDDGLLRIRHAKFDRDRLVPLHPSTRDALCHYVVHRERRCPHPRAETFFVSSVGTELASSTINATFLALLAAAGMASTGRHPRIHDLRHSLAVHTLIDWQRDGVDIASRLPVLSAYLGHVNPASTYWYLTATPELMQLVAGRLDRCPTDAPAGAS